ncbi:MAG: M48 family metallopeptidase [Oligoflexia bacterium]|nr:M48 family metallopeptidase [Oligoflexia bacterium]
MVKAEMVTKIFLIALVLKEIIVAWLDTKNKNHIINNSKEVPAKFSDSISLEEHQKAASYSVTKIKASQVFNLYDVAILLMWTLGGGLNSLEKIVAAWNLSPIPHALAYFAIFGLVSMLLGLPQSIYSTFVIEEKFGFNKTTPKIFVTDLIKGIIVGSVIGLPLLAGLIWTLNALGEYWWVYGWALLIGFQFILLWAYPRFIAPIFNKFSELEEGEVKEKVVGLLDRTGFTSKGLFVMNASMRSSHGNAYFTGFGKNKRIVFFDTLINTLNPEEVEAVLAHELGHFKKKHIMKQLIKGMFFSFIAFYVLGLLIKEPAFYQGHGVTEVKTHIALLLFSLVSGIYTFLMTPLSNFFSRKYEFEADEFAAQHAKPEKLITALVKMYKDNASTLTPDPTYSNFYHSHPPALIRVDHLESLQSKSQ